MGDAIMRFWWPGLQTGWVDNILEDCSLVSSVSFHNVAQQEAWFLQSSRSIQINRDVVAGLSSGEKLICFIFQLNVHLDYFQETDVILSRPAHAGVNRWEFAKEELNNLVSSYSVSREIVAYRIQLRPRWRSPVSAIGRWREYSKFRTCLKRQP